MRINNLFLFVLCCFIFTTNVSAEDNSFNLGEVVVSGEQPRVVESVSTVDIVTSEDIRRSGARNLNEAIKLLPGLYVRTGGDGTPRIDIRGLRTRQVMLLLDGVPINSAIDGQFDPSAIDVANIKRIKVTRGTSSLLYGSGGTAGVINIITKSAGKKFHADSKFEIGSQGTKRGQLSAGKGGEDWNVFASLSGYHRNSFILSDDYNPVPVTGTPSNFQPSGERINSDRTDQNLYANVLWHGIPGTEIGLSGSYREGYYGKPGEVRNFNGGDPFARRPKFERVDNFQGFSLNFTGKQEFTIPLTIRPLLYFNRLDELTNNYDDATFSTISLNRAFHQNTRSDIYGGGLQASYDFREFGLSSTALNCRREQWHAAGFTVEGKKNVITPLLIDSDQHICSVNLEHELKLFDRAGLTGGVGYDWQNRPNDINDDGMTYLLGGYVDVFEGTRIHVSHSHKLRFPTLRDLFEPGRANPNLKAETTNQYEVGILQTFTQIPASIGFTAFRTNAEDFIETDNNGIAQNIEEDRFEGIEITGNVILLDRLNLRTAYTYMESKNLSVGVTNRDLQNRPRHQLSIEADYQLPLDMNLYLSWLHIEGNIELSRQTPTLSRETGNYDVFDFKLEKSFGSFNLYGRAMNLLDEDYVESGGFPAPGRLFLVGAEISFGS